MAAAWASEKKLFYLFPINDDQHNQQKALSVSHVLYATKRASVHGVISNDVGIFFISGNRRLYTNMVLVLFSRCSGFYRHLSTLSWILIISWVSLVDSDIDRFQLAIYGICEWIYVINSSQCR